MNALSLLAIFLGLITIALYCIICALFDRNEQLRQQIGCEPLAAGCGSEAEDSPSGPQLTANSPQQERSDYSLHAAALDLIDECRWLERRNDWLESQRDHRKDVLALSMAQSRIPRRDKTRMEVAEMQEAP